MNNLHITHFFKLHMYTVIATDNIVSYSLISVYFQFHFDFKTDMWTSSSQNGVKEGKGDRDTFFVDEDYLTQGVW